MYKCLKEKDLKRLADGGSRSPEIDRHLAGCGRCSSEYRLQVEIGQMVDTSRQVVESALPQFHTRWTGALRNAQAKEEKAGRGRKPFFGAGLVWAARTATAGLVLALLLVPVLWNGSGNPLTRMTSHEPDGDAPSYSIYLEGDDFVIEWARNGDRVHQVARSTSPDDFSNATVTQVQGSRWVDSDPQQPGMVYYYRID